MALKRVQLVRHDAAGSATFLGRIGELTVNISKNAINVHDGITPGGFEQARADLSNVPTATTFVAGKMTAAQVILLNTLTSSSSLNAANIIVNADAIAVNVADIATNRIDIDTNAADILVNAANIALNTILANSKAAKAVSIVDGNLLVMDASGDLVDAGETLADVHDASQLTGTLPGVSLPQASETEAGVIELASASEVIAKTDALRALTPSDIIGFLGSPSSIGNVAPASGEFTSLNVNNEAVFNADFTSRGITDRSSVSSPSLYISSTGNVSVGNGVNATRRFNVEDADLPTYIEIFANGLPENPAGIVFKNALKTWFAEVLIGGGFSISSNTLDVLTFTISGRLDVANSNIVLDEDDMVSDSPDQLATQQSIKAYVGSRDVILFPPVVAGTANRVFMGPQNVVLDGTIQGLIQETRHTFLRSGTYTFSFRFRNNGNNGGTTVTVHRDVGDIPPSYTATSVDRFEGNGNLVTHTETLVVDAGDTVELHFSSTNNLGAFLEYFYISTQDPLFSA